MHLKLLKIENIAEATGNLIFNKTAGKIARIASQSATKTTSQGNEMSLEISKESYMLPENKKRRSGRS